MTGGTTSTTPAARPPLRGLSRVVLGTMTFADTVEIDVARRMLSTALDAGVSAVDTANGYAGGRTEPMLGALLAELPAHQRDRIVLATKAGMPHVDAGDHPPLSAAGLRASVEGSLRRLGLERIDLFYLHQPDRGTPVEETAATLRDLTDEGKIGALGVSNFAAWQIAQLDHAADAVGAPRPSVAQQLLNLLARRVEEEYLEFATTTGLLTMAYNPLAGGLLTGRYRFDQAPTAGRFGDSGLAAMYTQRYWDSRLFAGVDTLAGVAEQAGLPLPELAFRWVLGHAGVGAVLVGGSSTTHLQANLDAAARGPLPADVVAACDEVGDTLRGPMPAYNR